MSVNSIQTQHCEPYFGSTSTLSLPALEAFLAELPDAAILAGPDRRIQFVNQATVDLFGYPPEELLGRTTERLYTSAGGYRAQGNERYNPDSAAHHERYITRYRHRDGRAFEGETFGGPVRDGGGLVSGYLGVIRDVSVRESGMRLLSRIHHIGTERGLDFDTRIRMLLEEASSHFGLPVGILSRIEGDDYEVVQAVSPDGGLQPGTRFDLGETYCLHTLRADGPVGFHHVAHSTIREHPCYKTFQLEAYLGAPVVVDGERFGTLNFSSPEPTRPFEARDLELISLIANWAGHELARRQDLIKLERARAKLRHQARTDGLTGIRNRRAIEGRLADEVERSSRYGNPCTLLHLDLDHFKQVNDSHGHPAGDELLRQTATTLSAFVRNVDLVGRWGGEEFVVVLPETDGDGAAVVAERVRQRIHELVPPFAQGPGEVSASIGVAELQRGETLGELVARVDAALYRAKEGGRNRVVLDQPESLAASPGTSTTMR